METIPLLFLDLSTVEVHDVWPSFRYLGHALRIEYTTSIHREDGEWENFYHEFTSGVKVFEPEHLDVFSLSTREGSIETERNQPYELVTSVDPIVFAVVNSFTFLTPEGRTLLLVHKDAGVNVEDLDAIYFVSELPNSMLAWDPEGRQLLILSMKGEPLLVLGGGALGINDSAMIIG